MSFGMRRGRGGIDGDGGVGDGVAKKTRSLSEEEGESGWERDGVEKDDRDEGLRGFLLRDKKAYGRVSRELLGRK